MSEIKKEWLDAQSEKTSSRHAIYELRGGVAVNVWDIIEQKQALQAKREEFTLTVQTLKHKLRYELNTILLNIDIPKWGKLVLWTKEKEEKLRNDLMRLFPVIDEDTKKSMSLPIDTDTKDIHDEYLRTVEVIKKDIQEYIDNIKKWEFSPFTNEDEVELRKSIVHLDEYIFLKHLFPEIFASKRTSENKINI